ncbi:MAG: hypothetical protein Q9227_004833 [Pyrenula ochraceoflavens]
MGFTTAFLTSGTVTTLTVATLISVYTRKSYFTPMSSTTDAIFSSPHLTKLNPNRNPTTHDLCLRRVPLKDIKPSLLKESKSKPPEELTTAFCQGVWGGKGYGLQRAYMTWKYQTASPQDLWSPKKLLTNPYPVGTIITDHFEVLSHTPESVLVRCGDSPRKQGIRENDGLFEMSVKIDEEKGEAEFGLKSCFFRGEGKAEAEPMGEGIQWAHRVYTKVLMESGVRNCVKTAFQY